LDWPKNTSQEYYMTEHSQSAFSKSTFLSAVPDDYVSAPNAEALPTYIDIQDLKLSISEQIIFESLTLPIYKNHVNALIGPSGCGKSSLLNTITRLTDYTDNIKIEGKIYIDEKNILNSDVDLIKLRRKVGMIFQKPVPFPLSIRKNFELPLKEHGTKNKYELEEKMENALRDVGLWQEVANRLNKSAVQLSGGQQQRLCIARVLALEPKALLMDEPCSALDPMATSIIEALIQQLKEKYTILLVTHNLSQAKRTADYVAFMWYNNSHGKLIEHNHSDIIFNTPSNPITAAYVKGLTD